MSSIAIVEILIFSVIAIGGSLFLVLGLAGGAHVEPYIRKHASAFLPTLLLLGFAASTLISGRNASLYGLTSNILEEGGSGRGVWLLRIATALVVGISVLLITSGFLRKTGRQDSARSLFLAFTLYFVFSYVVSGLLGTELAISHKTFYPFIVVAALYITSDQDAELLLKIVRDSLLLVLLTGLCIIPIMPDLVLQKGYSGIIPGFSYRYWGLASHANNIGPLAIFFFLMLCWLPYKSRLIMIVSTVVACITLIMSQSKTSLFLVIFIAAIFAGRWWLEAIFKNKLGRAGSFMAISLGMFAAMFVLVSFVAELYARPIAHLLDKIQGQGTLLTGREFIWSITLAEWERNPIFGYGPNLWSDDFSARFGYLGIATNAHNQFFDTLGAAGVLGATSLLVYSFFLVRCACLLAGPSNWISIALVVFVATRSISEVPLKTMNITTSDFFMHAVIIGMFMRTASSLEKRRPAINLEFSGGHESR